MTVQMPIINNYLIVDKKGCLSQKKRGSTLIGIVSGDSNYPDGIKIKVEIEEAFFIGEGELYNYKVRTNIGRVYYLKKPHSDYRDYLEALDEGCPILTEWNLYGGRKTGYQISGMLDGERFPAQDITFQIGNYVYFPDGQMIFVDWGSFSHGVLTETTFEKKLLDLSYKYEMEHFGYWKCRPDLSL